MWKLTWFGGNAGITTVSESSSEPITAFFVYGTLQTGECRARCWPHPAVSIEDATIVGQLHNLGPYPALVEGNHEIAGELWRLAPEHLPRTLEVLDAVEAAAGEGKLYERRIVHCRLSRTENQAAAVAAYAYFYARPARLAKTPVIVASADGRCYWKHVAHRPTTMEDY